TTSAPSAGVSNTLSARAYAGPHRFMYVVGLTSRTRSTGRPAGLAVATRPVTSLLRSKVTPHFDAKRSTTSKPTLCRVLAYSSPGLPRPTTTQRRGPGMASSCPDGARGENDAAKPSTRGGEGRPEADYFFASFFSSFLAGAAAAAFAPSSPAAASSGFLPPMRSGSAAP